MRQFKDLILKTAKLREESWDSDLESYKLSLPEACWKAADECIPVTDIHFATTLLTVLWNETIEWAKEE